MLLQLFIKGISKQVIDSSTLKPTYISLAVYVLCVCFVSYGLSSCWL
jgi:hypothetical protein